MVKTLIEYMENSDLDALATFETASSLYAVQPPTRYAVRQVLDQELQRTLAQRENAARQARLRSGGPQVHRHDDGDGDDEDKENRPPPAAGKADSARLAEKVVRRDFFGRVIADSAAAGPSAPGSSDGNAGGRNNKRRKIPDEGGGEGANRVWVTYHEGLNNAVRKPISLEEFMRGF